MTALCCSVFNYREKKKGKNNQQKDTHKIHTTQSNKQAPSAFIFCIRPPPCFLFIRFIFSLLFSSLSFPTFSFSSKVVSNRASPKEMGRLRQKHAIKP